MVPGVARVSASQRNGRDEQILEILFDPYRAAQLGMDLPANSGPTGPGQRCQRRLRRGGPTPYTLRFTGRYEPQELSEFVLDWRDGRPVKLGDIADIRVTRGEQVLVTTQNGNPAIGIRIDKEKTAQRVTGAQRG